MSPPSSSSRPSCLCHAAQGLLTCQTSWRKVLRGWKSTRGMAAPAGPTAAGSTAEALGWLTGRPGPACRAHGGHPPEEGPRQNLGPPGAALPNHWIHTFSPDSGAVGSRPFSHSQARIPIRGTRVPSGPLDMSPGPAAKAPGRGRCAPRTFTWLCAQPSLPPCPFPENGTVPSSQERTTCSVALMTRDSQNQLQTWLTSPLGSVPLLLNHVLHQ